MSTIEIGPPPIERTLAGDLPVFLIGGGWSRWAAASVYGPFIAAAGARARIACVLLDEPGSDRYFERFDAVLRSAGAADVRAVYVSAERPLRLDRLEGADGVLVGGGLTAAYLAALRAEREHLAPWLRDRGVVYAGFSAGAALASERAIVGGWRVHGAWRLHGLAGPRAVCPEEASQNLDEVCVVPGLGLVPFPVDVHASQWGTLSRLLTVVRIDAAGQGWAIDEDTLLEVTSGAVRVHGLGHAYHARDNTAGLDVQVLIGGVVSPFLAHA